MLETIAMAGALLVVAAYFLSVRLKNPLILNSGNVIGAFLMVPANIMAGLEFAVFLNLAFGLIGLYGLYVWWKARQPHPGYRVGDAGFLTVEDIQRRGAARHRIPSWFQGK